MRQETAIWAESYFSAEERTQIHTHGHIIIRADMLWRPQTLPLVPAQSTVQQQTPTQPSFILSVQVCVCVCMYQANYHHEPSHTQT